MNLFISKMHMQGFICQMHMLRAAERQTGCTKDCMRFIRPRIAMHMHLRDKERQEAHILFSFSALTAAAPTHDCAFSRLLLGSDPNARPCWQCRGMSTGNVHCCASCDHGFAALRNGSSDSSLGDVAGQFILHHPMLIDGLHSHVRAAHQQQG